MTPQERKVFELALEALKKCDFALAEELAAWDIDPPLHHVLEASNACGPAITAIKEVLAQPEQIPPSAYSNTHQPEQEPVAWATREDFYRELDRSVERIRKEMEVKSVTMRCKDYDVVLPIINTHFGRVLVGQVSTPPQRKPLTDEQKMALCKQFPDHLTFNAIHAIEAAHGIKE